MAEWSEEQYRHARRALMVFFQLQGVEDAEGAAQEAITRCVEREREGVAIDERTAFLYGIARRMVPGILAQQRPVAEERGRPNAAALERLDRCLARCGKSAVSEVEWDLWTQYVWSAHGNRNAERSDMAKGLNISKGALRGRMFRIAERLRECIERCLNAPESAGD